MSDTNLTIEELALEERKFLHDISNHMSIAQGMVNIALKRMKDNGVDEAIIEKQEKALNALMEQTRLMKARRALLHTRG